jgi:hypothetical protein
MLNNFGFVDICMYLQAPLFSLKWSQVIDRLCAEVSAAPSPAVIPLLFKTTTTTTK